MNSLRRVILAMLFVLSLTAVVAWAQGDAPEKGDPPGRAARLQYMSGSGSIQPSGKGEGDATGQGPGVRVHSDQQVRFTNETSLTHEVAEAPAYDGFDSWCAVRDKRLDTSLSARYVAPGTVGYEDLDDNGVWTEEP